MFLRAHKVRNRIYYELLQSYRDPQGRPRHHCLGRWQYKLTLAEALAAVRTGAPPAPRPTGRPPRAYQRHAAQPPVPVEPALVPAANITTGYNSAPAAPAENITAGNNAAPAPSLGRFITPAAMHARQTDFDQFLRVEGDRVFTVLLAASAHPADRDIAQALGLDWSQVMRVLLFLRDQQLISFDANDRVRVAVGAIDEFNDRLDRSKAGAAR